MSRELPKGVYKYKDKFVAKLWEETTGKHTHVGTYSTPEEAEYHRNCMANGHHWVGIKLNPKEAWGFIYKITNRSTGKIYYGRKQYRLWAGPPGGYKCTDPRDSEWFSPEAWRDNKWRWYTGSCNELNRDIDSYGVYNFTFEALEECYNKLDLHLAEVLLQMEEDVLEAVGPDGSYTHYNANIAGMEFRPPFLKSEVVDATRKSMEDLHLYYLKPKICKDCGSVVPYKGDCSCES